MEVIITVKLSTYKPQILKGLIDGITLDRHVTILNSMDFSKFNFKADISIEELDTLRRDARIRQVERLDEMKVRALPILCSESQTINPAFEDINNQEHDNYALHLCSSSDGSVYEYTHDGQDIDVVVIDTGVLLGHSEFEDSDGNSRIQEIEWKENQLIDKPEFYTDQYGHGTHVTATIAGKTQGWARNANIYIMKVYGTDAYDIYEALSLIRDWHIAKNNSRSTIINNSWGYESIYPDNYPEAIRRGHPHPIRVESIDIEFESLIALGIVVTGASGNSTHYLAGPDEVEWNEFYYTDANYSWVETEQESTYKYYFNRKSPAGTNGVVCVGSIGVMSTLSKLTISTSSNLGPRIDVFAPGRSIQSAKADLTEAGLLIKMSGTSIACAQVTGILAIYMSMLSPESAKKSINMLEDLSEKDIVQGDLYGSTNLLAKTVMNNMFIYGNSTWSQATSLTKRNGAWQFNKVDVKTDTNVISKVVG